MLAGTVERVTFHNAESGFCVLRIKARAHRDLVTIVGHAATIAAGEWITASGEWVNDRTHGQQFKARFMRTSAPSSIEGIELGGVSFSSAAYHLRTQRLSSLFFCLPSPRSARLQAAGTTNQWCPGFRLAGHGSRSEKAKAKASLWI